MEQRVLTLMVAFLVVALMAGKELIAPSTQMTVLHLMGHPNASMVECVSIEWDILTAYVHQTKQVNYTDKDTQGLQ